MHCQNNQHQVAVSILASLHVISHRTVHMLGKNTRCKWINSTHLYVNEGWHIVSAAYCGELQYIPDCLLLGLCAVSLARSCRRSGKAAHVMTEGRFTGLTSRPLFPAAPGLLRERLRGPSLGECSSGGGWGYRGGGCGYAGGRYPPGPFSSRWSRLRYSGGGVTERTNLTWTNTDINKQGMKCISAARICAREASINHQSPLTWGC